MKLPNLDLSKAAFTARSFLTANSPALLVATAVVGIVGTGIVAAKGGYKARGIIDDARGVRVENVDLTAADLYVEVSNRLNAPDLTVLEKAQLTWLCYAVPAVTGASTIASVIGLHTIHNKRHAALAGLYAIAAGKLDDVQTEAEKLLGSKKNQDLNNALAKKSADTHPIGLNHEVIIADNPGRELCQDEWAARWHNGSHAVIETAFAKLNELLAENGEATLNDFYDFIGLPPSVAGQTLGWGGAGVDGKRIRVEPRFGTVSTNEAEPRPAISYRFHPVPK